jgi:hypothetical protein
MITLSIAQQSQVKPRPFLRYPGSNTTRDFNKSLLSSSEGIYIKTSLSVVCITECTSIQIFIVGKIKSCGVKQGGKLYKFI